MSSAESTTAADPLLDRLVAEDDKIERRQDSAILALMEHRWKAVHEHGYSRKAYARALGHKSDRTVRRYVKGWGLWQEGRPQGASPLDVLTLAGMSEEQAEAAKIVAEGEGIGIAQVSRSDKHRIKIRQVRSALAEDEEEEEEPIRRSSWRDGQPRVRDLMDESDPFNPGEHWSDTFIISLGKTSRELEGRVKSAGGVILGTLSAEKALKYLKETERRVADVRAAVQEIINEGKL